MHATPDHADDVSEIERAKIASPSYYLLRPDGHVALAGGILEPGAVARYIADHLRQGDRAR